MNILILGSGGREHALTWKLSQSPLIKKLYIAPGNAGTLLHGENLNFTATDFSAIKQTVIDKKIDMVLVGPEDPLVAGIHDFFLNDKDIKKIPVIGPLKNAAILEGSKDFAKHFMKKYNIPTARYQTFTKDTINKAFSFLETLNPPYVLKADGLAAGKGVTIIENLNEAKKEIENILLNSKFGEAGKKLVIEEFLNGIELSVFIITDGNSYRLLPSAKDYKKIGEGDTGPNTGGMGTISPVPFADKIFMEKVEKQIVLPTIHGLKSEGITYKGFIFFGLMNVEGYPYVIEYNARLGDPETQSIIPRIKNDFVELLMAVAENKIHQTEINIDEQTAATVVLVSKGYPENYEKGKIINGFENIHDSFVFHAGTKKDNNGQIVTNGGRVLAITSLANDLFTALDISYKNAEKIFYEGKYYRKDIGKDLFKYVSA